MKVGLLTESVSRGLAGFGVYARGLGTALAARDLDLTFVDTDARTSVGAQPEVKAPPPWLPALGRQAWRQVVLPAALDAAGYDLVHDTYFFAPFLREQRFARVVTIGDLTPSLTRSQPLRHRLVHSLLVPRIARRAHRVLAFSENTKRDITRVYGVPPERIAVTYLAAEARFRPLPPPEIEAAHQRLGLPRQYFLHVGTLEPRKNLGRLSEAFAAARHDLDELTLLIVGRPGWLIDDLPGQIRQLGIEDRVVFRSDISDADLPHVYGGARFLAYPSLYEGFGLPPLEAMQCGVPVVTSNTSSLPEVVGDAALTVDPTSVGALTDALVQLGTNSDLRATLAARGLTRAQRFSWEACADATLAAYTEAYALAAVPRPAAVVQPVSRS
jgi:glycosyltransferase involved in cell wall biosynthesis